MNENMNENIVIVTVYLHFDNCRLLYRISESYNIIIFNSVSKKTRKKTYINYYLMQSKCHKIKKNNNNYTYIVY